MKLALIGGGNMGGSLLRALEKNGMLSGDQTLLLEPDPEKREMLSEQTGCIPKERADKDLNLAETLLIAVKPQISSKVMEELKPFVGMRKLVISVMAGVSISTMKAVFGEHRFGESHAKYPLTDWRRHDGLLCFKRS